MICQEKTRAMPLAAGQENAPAVSAARGQENGAEDEAARILIDTLMPRAGQGPAPVYLAGPYSAPAAVPPDMARRIRAERARRHTLAAVWCKRQGLAVLSPVVMGHHICLTAGLLDGAQGLPPAFDGWEAECLGMLSVCRAMLVLDLPGLHDSVGTGVELGFAARAGLPIRLLTPLTDGRRYRVDDLDVAAWAARPTAGTRYLHGEVEKAREAAGYGRA